MPVKKEEILEILKEKFKNSQIEVIDNHGTGDSYSINIKSPDFAGKPLVKQHKMVMDSLKEKLKEELHAVSIKTGLA